MTPISELDPGVVELLGLARASGALTRAQITERTGWARGTVNARLDRLFELGLLVGDGRTAAQRGRPAARFRFNPARAALLVADVGASGMRLGVCDLAGEVIAHSTRGIDIASGPEPVLADVEAGLSDLLTATGATTDIWGVAISLPGPVERATGAVVDPPIMTGWNGYRVADRLAARFSAAVMVDNDVNAMALGEQRSQYPDCANLVFLKAGTGVGLGIIANAALVSGSQGAAGDIGHTWADVDDPGDERRLCRCGKRGCLEAYASGWAILRDLAEAGEPADSVAEVTRRVHLGDARATNLVRTAGRVIGAAVADIVNLLNPSVVVLGGQLAGAGEHLLAGIRAQVYARSLPLATRDLVITTTRLGDDAGLIGLAHMLADQVLTGAAGGSPSYLPPATGPLPATG